MKLYFDGVIYSWKTGGGVVRYCNELISGLCALPGVEASLILQEPFFNAFPTSNNLDPQILFKYHLPYQGGLRPYFRKILSPSNKALMEKYFKGISAGVFHSTYYTTFNSLSIPQVLTVYDLIQERFENFFNTAGDRRFIAKKRRCIERADAIICISETTKKDLIERYPVNGDKVYVIYPGLSRSFLERPTVPEIRELLGRRGFDRPFLLFLGHRIGYKNFTFLLKTFAQWAKKNDFLLALAGGGLFTKQENQLAESLGLKDRLKVLGGVTEKELNILYRSSSAFIFPSLYEGFGLPIIEALACNARVLASDIAVFREIGGSRVDYFNPNSEADLLSALDNITRQPKTGLTAAGLEKLANDYDWPAAAKKTFNIYQRAHRR